MANKNKRIIVVGSDFQWEEQLILEEIKKRGIPAEFLSVGDMEIVLGKKTRFLKNGRDIFDDWNGEERFIIRRSRWAFIPLVVFTEILQKRGFIFTDSFRSIGTNLNKEIFMPTIESDIFPHPESFFVEKGHDISQKKLTFPLISKPVSGRHGEGIVIHHTRESLQDGIYESEESLIVQKFLDIDYEFRIFVIGNKSLGAVQKIPEKGSQIANYAAGAKFQKIELDSRYYQEAIRLCQIQEIDIGGVDIARTKSGEYFLLEINRCPEFKAFSKAIEVNIAEKIIDFILAKK